MTPGASAKPAHKSCANAETNYAWRNPCHIPVNVISASARAELACHERTRCIPLPTLGKDHDPALRSQRGFDGIPRLKGQLTITAARSSELYSEWYENGAPFRTKLRTRMSLKSRCNLKWPLVPSLRNPLFSTTCKIASPAY